MIDDDNVFKRFPPETIRFMSDDENPFINRADIIPDMSTFGTSKPGGFDNPNHDGLLGSNSDPEGPDDDYDDAYDFGASRAEFRPEAGDARDRGDLHRGIADAVGQLDGFAKDLTRDDGFETYPARLSAETRRIGHEIGGRIADGKKRDLFDNAFELMSQNAATEIRGVATERMVAKNRDGLNRVLDTYAGLIARSGNPVTTDFAGNHGLNAIDAQVRDGIIDEEEGARLTLGFLADIDNRSAISLIQDDPEGALAELANPSAYPNLAPERTHELSAHANLRREAAKLDAQQAASRAEQGDRRDQSRKADDFEAQYRTALTDGTATLAQLSDGALDGTITPDRAQRLTKAHEAAQAKREDEFRLAGIVGDALESGGILDPNDPDHVRAADQHFAIYMVPELKDITKSDGIAAIRDRFRDLGITPPAMQRTTTLWWRSGNPNLAIRAAYLSPEPSDDMQNAIALHESGMAGDEAVPVALKMAAEAAGNSDAPSAPAKPADKPPPENAASEGEASPDPDEMLDGDGATSDETETFDLTDDDFGGAGRDTLTSGSFRDGADEIVDNLDAAQDGPETEPQRSLSREELDARTEAVQQLFRDAVNPALDQTATDAEFRARAEDLGLDPDRAELHRDIARVSPQTEAGVRARIEEMTKPYPGGIPPKIDPLYRVVLDRKVKDNLGLAANDPNRAFVAGRMANLLGRKGVNVTRRVVAEDLGLAAGAGALGKGIAGVATARGKGEMSPKPGLRRSPGPGRESDFPSPKEYAAYRARKNAGMPLGFTSQAQKQAFTKNIAKPLADAGYKDAKIAMRGSAVTGAQYNPKTGKYDGPAFDKGRVSDHDVAIISQSLFEKAKNLGIKTLNNGRRTVELSTEQIKNLGLQNMPKNLAMPRGSRDTTYMIYKSHEALLRRGPSINLN